MSNPDTFDVPNEIDYYFLAVGNVYKIREYTHLGIPVTGEGTDRPDISMSIIDAKQQVDPSSTKTVFILNLSDGTQQHLLQIEDKTTKDKRIAITQLLFKGFQIQIEPPLIVLFPPVGNNTKWGPYQTKVSTSILAHAWASYSGIMTGPFDMSTLAGDFTDVYKVTITYVIKVFGVSVLSGEEYYWFAPHIGLIQHGYKRGSDTVIPYRKIVSAVVQGIHYPS